MSISVTVGKLALETLVEAVGWILQQSLVMWEDGWISMYLLYSYLYIDMLYSSYP